MEEILTPPIAFLMYLPLVTALFLFGKLLAGKEKPNPIKTSVYGSGEEAPTQSASPGYTPFFLIALFFAILHLSMLVLGIGGYSVSSGIFLIGVIFALGALILG